MAVVELQATIDATRHHLKKLESQQDVKIVKRYIRKKSEAYKLYALSRKAIVHV